MEWYLKVLKNYIGFSGRSRRKEFWMFTLVNIIIGFLFGILSLFTSTGTADFLSTVYSLAILLPSLAVTVRRLHDIDFSGWWILLMFVPVLGTLALLVMCCLKGTSGPNRFGHNPLNEPEPGRQRNSNIIR